MAELALTTAHLGKGTREKEAAHHGHDGVVGPNRDDMKCVNELDSVAGACAKTPIAFSKVGTQCHEYDTDAASAPTVTQLLHIANSKSQLGFVSPPGRQE